METRKEAVINPSGPSCLLRKRYPQTDPRLRKKLCIEGVKSILFFFAVGFSPSLLLLRILILLVREREEGGDDRRKKDD